MHPPDEPVATLSRLLADRGMAVEPVTEPSAVTGALQAPPDLLVVAACWFSMTDARYSDEQRAGWAVPSDPVREQAIADAVAAGTAVLSLHTGVICFDDWVGWEQVLGGRWDWSTSSHPPPAELAIEPVGGDIDIGSDMEFGGDIGGGSDINIEPFTVVDEEYRGLRVGDDSRIVARSAEGHHPLVWLIDGSPRRAVDLLGHDRRSLDHPGHRRLLGQLIDWLLAGRVAP